MRKLWIVIISLVLFSGCSIANTPTSKVEDFLGKYQSVDDSISLAYMQLSIDEDISEEYKNNYQELIEKQYKSLSYEVKDEEIDGDSAFITTEIKVYDYKEIMDKYDKDSYSNNEYHKLVIDGLKEQKDKIVYTIVFELAMNEDDEWEVLDLSYEDQEKLLGIN